MIKAKIYFFLLVVSFLYHQQAFGSIAALSERASNPITNLSQLQLENDFTPKNYGSHDVSNKVLIKPLIAFNQTDWFPFEQLIRFKCQIPTLPNSSVTRRGTSLGDTQFFDLFITEESWGRWGVGPMMIFPTATVLDAGQGKWQIGPAIGLSILKFPHWQMGFLAQNPISFAGNSKKAKQNYLLLQPFIIYHFLKNSYFISNSEWTFNWLSKAKQIPLNIGIGHTFSIMSLKVDSAIQFQFMAYQNAVKTVGFVSQRTIQISFNFLFD